MNLFNELRTFVRVASCGNFSLAAGQLGVAQPCVSKHIASLERRLGATLLSRNTRQVRLTQEGTVYLRFAQRLLEDVKDAETQVARTKIAPAGLVRIVSPSSFAQRFLLSVSVELMKRYPLIALDLAANDLSPSLIEHDIDIAIRFGDLQGDLITRPLGTARRLAVASPSYIAQYGMPKVPHDLLRHNCLIYSNPIVTSGWTFIGKDGSTTVKVSGGFSSNSALLIKDACLAGLGVAVMPYWLFDEQIVAGKLVRVLDAYEANGLPLSIVYPSRRYISTKIRAVANFVYGALRRSFDQSAKHRTEMLHKFSRYEH